MLSILLIGVSLSMDALAISITNGMTLKDFSLRHALWMGLYFGGFQFLMPLLGCLLGSTVSGYVSAFGPYISFFLLAFIGGKMLWDAFHEEPEEVFDKQAKLTIPVLFFQAIATSIDALAVGVSFAALSLNIASAATLIGLTTALCCIVALILGRHFGMKLGNKATIIGGIVLIAIGIKALFM